jgi:hypothetical protein
LRVCSDQDVTTLTAACIPVGEDVGAGPTSPAPTLHQDGHGGAAPTMNTLGGGRSPFGAMKFGYPRAQARALGRSMKGRWAQVKETS